jgi:hypothetical protein
MELAKEEAHLPVLSPFPQKPYKASTILLFTVFGLFVAFPAWVCFKELVIPLLRASTTSHESGSCPARQRPTCKRLEQIRQLVRKRQMGDDFVSAPREHWRKFGMSPFRVFRFVVGCFLLFPSAILDRIGGDGFTFTDYAENSCHDQG